MLWLVYSCDGEGATDASTFDLEKGELNHFKSSPKTLFPSQANVVKLPPQHLHWNLILHQQQPAAAQQQQHQSQGEVGKNLLLLSSQALAKVLKKVM